MDPVSSKVDFAAEEMKILTLWDSEKTFAKSNKLPHLTKKFAFYDGPPFANGLPHYGHLLANTIKDIVPRYWNMKGFFVDRRFGWDCHGLPVEYEIEKIQGLKGRQDILDMGIDVFNEFCRKSVLHYTVEWKKTITSLGRWVDWDNQYRTMDLEFMESVWWVFKELDKKGLVYQGHKVVPYSPRITAVLSNFEANQNYQNVQDPAITVMFPLVSEDAYLLAWTTTPWTLVSNLALAVGPSINYLKVQDEESKLVFYVGKDRFEHYFGKKSGKKVQLICEVTGKELIGKKYRPLFPYYQSHNNGFSVLSGDYINTKDGTGIVHLAPCYGEEDFALCNQAGIALVDSLDIEGKFQLEITDFAGLSFKDADKPIIRKLKEQGQLFKNETLMHSYPYCERTNSPLIYRAIPAWYVAVEKIKGDMIANNQKINWVPEHLKNGRMGKWLENARDWAVSRNRFWGTPIPVWVCDRDKKHQKVIGSKLELENLTSQPIDDLHKHKIDDLSFPCSECSGQMKRVQEVFDCWFESGSMPYAQLHYPFENQENFEQVFPADFIAEGLDQTRGWFYTLNVLSTALFNKPAFKNVVVNGMVLAEDGRKMSKRWKNYTPPGDLIGKYGADSVRLYMLNSAILRGEDLKFSDQGVLATTRALILPLWNAYSFLATYADADGWSAQDGACENLPQVSSKMDSWLLSRLHSLASDVDKHMLGYRLYLVVPVVLNFIEELTNWYIRANRRRFWGGAKQLCQDSQNAYQTLFYVLANFCKLLAPFAPFITDTIYRGMTAKLNCKAKSVHLCQSFVVDVKAIDGNLESSMSLTKTVVELGRSLRSKHQIKTRQVLSSMTIVSRDEKVHAFLKDSSDIIAQELNIKKLEFSVDEGKYVELTIKPNLPVLGRRLGKKIRGIQSALMDKNKESQVVFELLDSMDKNGSIVIDNEHLLPGDVIIQRSPRDKRPVASNRGVTVLLDTELTKDLIVEGYAREIVNRIQTFRRDLDLNVSDRINLNFSGDQNLVDAFRLHQTYISSETLIDKCNFGDAVDKPHSRFTQEFEIGDSRCTIRVQKIE